MPQMAPENGQPGSGLSPSVKTGAKTGNIINVAKHSDGDYAVLAVIQISDAGSTEIRLGDANGPPLKLQELPYTVKLQNKNED